MAREARRKLGNGTLEDEERKQQEIEAAATAARAASAAAVTTQIVEAEERRQRAAAETERLRAEIELMRTLSAQEESERKRLEDERVRQEEQERREREAERLRQAEQERRWLVEKECKRLEAREREEMQEVFMKVCANNVDCSYCRQTGSNWQLGCYFWVVSTHSLMSAHASASSHPWALTCFSPSKSNLSSSPQYSVRKTALKSRRR